LVLELA